jgi:hypothetical protein
LKGKKDSSFFATFDFKHKLTKMLEENWQNLYFNKMKPACEDGDIKDVYDGTLYKEIVEKEQEFVSFSFSFDGVNVKNKSFWPLSAVVNELPKEIRYKKENILILGLWYGKTPKMKTFMKPFVEKISLINKDRLQVFDKNLKVIPLLCPTDTCARPKIQEMTQFNGAFGCHVCLHPGDNKFKGSTNNMMKYPYRTGIPIRSESETLKTLLQHPTRKNPIDGIKGQSILVQLEHFSLIRGCPPDDMHGSYIGVGNQILDKICDSSNWKEPYYMGREFGLISKRLREFRLPSGIMRQPRAIEDRKKWKATDVKNFFLFYAYPCLCDLLPKKYFNNIMQFSEALHILSRSKITQSDLKKAENNITTFVRDYEKLYGTNAMTFNVHTQLHLKKAVENCGPLFAFSTFPFENKYGHLVKMIHGTTDIIKQLSLKISWDTEEKSQIKKTAKFETTSGLKSEKHKDFVKFLQEQEIYDQTKNFKSYKKIYLNEVCYAAANSSSRIDNSYVILNNDTIGSINEIFEYDSIYYLRISSEYTVNKSSNIDHITLLKKKKKELLYCQINSIKEKVIFLKTDSVCCISKFPNNLCID